MKNPFRILFVLIAPIHSRNILYLVKRGKFKIAVPLISLHLKLFYSENINSLSNQRYSEYSGDGKQLSNNLLKSLAMMGFINLHNQEIGLVSEQMVTFDSAVMHSKGAQNERLRSHIEGKSIALVGPSIGNNNSEEIDSFDLVLRIGYVGPDSLPEGGGERCDIAYYQEHKVRGIKGSGKYEPVKSLDLVLLPLQRGTNSDKEFLKSIGVKEEAIAELGALKFYFGSANALVKVLYHVLLCEPRRVKVFNTDLFLSKVYPKGYIGNKTRLTDTGGWRYEDEGMCRSFASKHNPLEQLIFYKELYRQGYFEADSILHEIINMSRESYCDRLDELYGRPLREGLGLA
jgi:hypothetical protein